jgi:hypothetical protein
MRARTLIGTGAAAAAAGVLLGWPTWAAVTWARYGRGRGGARRDALVDRHLPAYEVAETHETRVRAPASLTWAAATGVGLEASPVVRAIVHARERLLGVRGGSAWPPGGIVAQLLAWGWGVLAEVPGREVVLGAVTQPWQGDVRFRALAPEAWAAFDEPGHVRIVTAIAVEPLGADGAVVRVHTRVATTDATARARFRRYWAAFSPGILLIRRAMLREIRREAERRHRATRSSETRSDAARPGRARPPAPRPGAAAAAPRSTPVPQEATR